MISIPKQKPSFKIETKSTHYKNYQINHLLQFLYYSPFIVNGVLIDI